MVQDTGYVKVLDLATARSALTGSPAYYAPEVIKGFGIPGSDVYSLGVCLYEAVVGQLPFGGDAAGGKKYIPAAERMPEVPTRFDELVVSALAEDPRERLGSPSEFSKRLAAL